METEEETGRELSFEGGEGCGSRDEGAPDCSVEMESRFGSALAVV